MNLKKTIPAVAILSIIAGVGFAHGSTTLSRMWAETTSPPTAGTNPDVTADLIAVKAEIASLTARLRTLESRKTGDSDRPADIAALRKAIRKLRARLAALQSGKTGDSDRPADIAALRKAIRKLRARLTALQSGKTGDLDRPADIAAIRHKIAELKERLRTLREENHPDFDRADRDFRDPESIRATLHQDGDDRHPGLGRADFERDIRDAHWEATREIMRGSHQRVASLYSPTHHAGFHARMHRHSR